MEEARLKWANLAKEHNVLATQVKKVPQLEAKVEELKHTVAILRGVH